MNKVYTVQNTLQENRKFLNRVLVVFLAVVLTIAGLVARLVYLQISGHEHYSTMAKTNRIKSLPLPPTRGIIYDAKGRVLAQNTPVYSLELIPEQIKDMDHTLRRLQNLLNISNEKIQQFLRQQKASKRFSSIPLLWQLTDEEAAKFAAVRPYYSGVDIQARLIRNYPYGDLTAHVVGYIGRINAKELATLSAVQYSGSHHIGKTGIEKFYETQLHGKTGYAEMQTNAQGRAVQIITSNQPTMGNDIYLTLDIDLQKTASVALAGHSGAIVAIKPKTGEVLALVSQPSFDPNPFVAGMSSKAYRALHTSQKQPLFNRALHGQYPPGSTVKPFLGLASLQYGVATFTDTINCQGSYKLPNSTHKYRDWKKNGHGKVSMKEAIIQSCDVYFYDLARNLGIDRIYQALHQFGFGEKTNIDLLGEKKGLLPSRAWKRQHKNQAWFPGETLISGIGQGFTQVTVLQLAKATATLANNGVPMTPHLLHKITNANSSMLNNNQQETPIQLQNKNLQNIVDSMVGVIHSQHGTARRLRNKSYKIAGKTGTAQVFGIKQEEEYDEDKTTQKLKDHAIFIAFAPASDPQIAVAVIVENGGHGGSTAAPMAGKIIKQFLHNTQKGV